MISKEVTVANPTSQVIGSALATAGKPYNFGIDPSKYRVRFQDWYEHMEATTESN